MAEFRYGPVELYLVGFEGDRPSPDTAAALAALELVYARRLADKLASSGGVVLSAERIPAPIVNAVMDLAEEA